MNNETKILGGILLGSVILIIGAVLLLGKQSTPKSLLSGAAVNIDYSKAEKIGTDSAKLKLTEFSDFQCPACLSAEPVVEDILKAHPADVQLIYMNFPLPQHTNAKAAAEAALEASAEGKFPEMHNKLFETQNEWSDLDPQAAESYLSDLGKQVGVDPQKIKEAIDNNTYQSKINDTMAVGNSTGVSSTPTFYINGKKVNMVTGYQDLKTAVDQELKK